MSDFIPRELLIDILKRLSVEDLVRSQTVCKSWYSLIKNPSFISLHTQNQSSPTNNNNNNPLLLVRAYSDQPDRESYSIRFDNDTFEEYKNLNFPFKSRNSHFRVIGCFNGVLCLSDDLRSYTNTFILWNPSIRKFVTLPEPVWYGCYNHSIGFAFIAATNDYKVVRVFHLEEDGGMVDKVPPEVEVYDLSSGHWRTVDPKGFPYIVNPRSPQAFVNGAVHWVGSSQTQIGDGYFNMIVSFDMEREVLGAIEMPESVAYDESWPCTYRVSVVGEWLSLIHPTLSEDGLGDACCIWVMKRYGEPETWTKLFAIDLVGRLENALGFLKNGHALVTECTHSLEGYEIYRGRLGSILATYDPESKQVKDRGIKGIANAFYVDDFVESLALLDVKGESVQEAKPEDKVVSGLLPPPWFKKLGVSVGEED